jgi:hypothetical protein
MPVDPRALFTHPGANQVWHGGHNYATIVQAGLFEGRFYGAFSPTHHKQISAVWLTKTIFMIRLVRDSTGF